MPPSSILSRLCISASIAASLSSPLYAQTSLGQIAGTVTDSTGGVVPNASLTIKDIGTQAVHTAQSDTNGFFVVTNLPIGDYSVTATVSGFRGETRTGLSITADAKLTANFQLQVGAASESVNVTAVTGETINTTSGELAHVIDTKQVEALPLNGRNYTQLMTLIPGAVVTNPDIFSVTTSLASTNQTINGNRSDSSNLTVDGAYNQAAGSNGSLINNVSPDFIQEVKIETSNFSAEFGRTSGPAFNIITKSGSDQFHGVVFEYLRNNLFDARPFFSAFKTQLVYNDFGYGVGGPIIKEKLFFFVGEEFKRLRQQQAPTTLTVPSSALLAGNFAGLTTNGVAGGPPLQLVFPGTNTPIPNNNISALITPDGRAIGNVYSTISKLGQFTDTPGGLPGLPTNNLIVTPSNPLNFREDFVRLDYKINERNNIYGRWISDHNSLIDPFGTFATSNGLPTTPTQRNRPGQSYLLSETFTLNSNVINTATANFSFVSQHIPPYGDNWKRETFGFQYARLFPGGGTYPNGIPQVSITNFNLFQGPNFALNSPTTDIQAGDTVSVVKGSHLIKFGGVYIRDRIDQNGRPFYTGNVVFNASGNPLSTGNALADALLGNFQSYTEASADPVGHFRFSQPEAFVQDTWKASQKLSLEYGVRWQLLLPIYTQGNNIANFDPAVYAASTPVTVTTAGKIIPGSGNAYAGLVRPKDAIPSDQISRVPNINTAALPFIPAVAPRGLYKQHGSFGPRLGFSYSPNEKLAIRGGFGVFYYRAEGNVDFSQANIQPFLQNVEFDNANLANIAAGTANNTGIQGSLSAIDPGLKTPYVEQFSLGFQQELPAGILLETTYVSNIGHHLIRQPNVNFPSLAGVAANPSFSTNYFNPFKGFGSISQYRSDSNTNYNALQMYLTKRRGHTNYTVSYTYSKALGDSTGNGVTLENWQSLPYNYGPLSNDRRHAFVATVVYQLPTFAGHNALLRETIGGFQITAVARVQSGPYYTITGNTSTGTRRANYVPGTAVYQKGPSAQLTGHVKQWINPAAFTAAPAGSFGNAGVGQVLLPGLQQGDVTLSKIFSYRERYQFKLQADSFNVLNHTNYSALNTTATGGTAFGRLTASSPPRQFQLGAKFIF